MKNTRRVPINRVNKFFSENDYQLQIQMGRESVENFGNFVVILFKVNRERTQFDDIYGEATNEGIKYHPPMELKVVPIINSPENKTYNKNGSLNYLEDGQLTFGIYQDQLDELETDISYGDYIGYQISENEIRYYSVVNDGRKNYDNKHTILGYKGTFRTVICSVVDETEFTSI